MAVFAASATRVYYLVHEIPTTRARAFRRRCVIRHEAFAEKLRIATESTSGLAVQQKITDPVAKKQLASQVLRQNRMRATILVVDSEPVVRDIIRKILEREGYRVMPAADPKAALQIVESSHPSLVITNVNLPGMTGHDAMRLFKERCPGVPVLMVSGLPQSDVIEDWIAEDGFDAFPKPFSGKDLAAKVSEVLAKPVRS